MNNKTPLNGPSFESSEKPEKLVFLFHGYGDNAENFIPLATHLHNPELNINFYAPMPLHLFRSIQQAGNGLIFIQMA